MPVNSNLPSLVSRITPKNLLAAAAGVLGGVLIGVLAAGGTYALWNDEAPVSAGTVVLATIGVTIDDQPSVELADSGWANLLPGEYVSQEVILKNTGSIPVRLDMMTTGNASEFEVRAARDSCAGVIGGPSSTVSPVPLGVLASEEADTVCIQVLLPASATVQGAVFDFTVLFDATQVT